MKIVFLGAEVVSHRTLLQAHDVTNLGLSYWRLLKSGRVPKTKPYLVREKFSPGTLWVDGGGQSLLGEVDDLSGYLDKFDAFVSLNIEDLAAVIEFDVGLSPADRQARRESFYDFIPGDRFIPVWSVEDGPTRLEALAEKYPRIGIPHDSIESSTTLAGLTNRLVSQYGTRLHAIACARADNLRSIRFDSASTQAWISPMRRGELIAWDGTRLVRYRANMRDQARPRLVSIAAREGLDPDLVVAGDPKEMTRLAIKAYQHLEKHMDDTTRPFQVIPGGKEADNRDDPHGGDIADTLPVVADHSSSVAGNSRPAPPKPRHPSQTRTLPVFAVEEMRVSTDEGDATVISDVPVLRSRATSLRQCSTCFVSSTCPAYDPGSTCAFDLPVSVRTKEQMKALLHSVIEMQATRVAFARYAEEMNGGYPDPNLSQEIDRLFKITEAVKRLEQNNEFVRLTVERQTAGGVLSSIFGERAQGLSNLDVPVDPSRVIVQELEE